MELVRPALSLVKVFPDGSVLAIGELADSPSVFTVNEAALDPGRVPTGASSLKIIVTTVPVLDGWADAGQPYADHVVAEIDREFMPGLREAITARRVMTPDDYAQDVLSAIGETVTAR